MAGFQHLNDRQLRRRAARDAAFAASAQANLIGRQARLGEKNVAGITEALAKAQGGYGASIKDIYSRAQSTLGGLATEQRQTLGQTGGGGTLADQLAHGLQQSGQSSDLSNALATATSGAAGAGFGTSSAELGALAQRQAAAEAFGAKLPELARLTGLQGVQDRQAQANSDLAKLRAQSAAQTLDQLNRGRSQQFQEGAANLAYTGKVMQEQGKNARAGATLTLAQQKANEDARYHRALTRISQGKGDTAAARAAEIQRHNKWVEQHPNASGGGRGGTSHTGIDEQQSAQRGVLIDKKTGKVIKYPKGTHKHGKDVGGKPIPYRPSQHVGSKSGGGKSGL